MEKCVNCGASIGALETALSWKGSTVCAVCHRKLTDQLRPKGPTPKNKYVDYLRFPRLIVLLAAIAVSCLLAGQGKTDYTIAFWLWGAWIALGVVAIVQKANWKQRQS